MNGVMLEDFVGDRTLRFSDFHTNSFYHSLPLGSATQWMFPTMTPSNQTVKWPFLLISQLHFSQLKGSNVIPNPNSMEVGKHSQVVF